jgi:hypothetical protein
LLALAFWVALSALLIAARASTRLWLAIALAVRVLVPSVAFQVDLGWGSLHPATVLILMLAGARVVGGPDPSLHELRRSRIAYVLAAVVAAGVVLSQLRLGLVQSLLAITDAILAPMVFLLLFRSSKSERSRGAVLLVALALGALESVLAVIQYAIKDPIVYAGDLERLWWFSLPEFTRGQGTLDSPLDLSLWLVVCVALLTFVQSSTIRYALSLLYFAGVLASGSRFGLIVGGAALLFALGSGRRSLAGRLVVIAIGGAVGVLTVFSSFGLGVQERFADDDYSTASRLDAYNYLSGASVRILSGRGYGSSYSLKSSGVLASSLENAYAMFVYDFGWVLGVLLIVSQSWLLLDGLRRGPRGSSLSPRLAGLVAILVCFSYSSFETASAAGLVLWFAIGFATELPRGARFPDELAPVVLVDSNLASIDGRARSFGELQRSTEAVLGESPPSRSSSD